MNAWGSRTTAELIQYIQTSMPPASRGGLSAETYANIVAFFLQANGAPAGDRPLTVSTPVRIDYVANGQMPPALREALAKDANADQSGVPRHCAQGISVAGQVKNYVPITDNTLRNPNPADWLMAAAITSRGADPLAQITPKTWDVCDSLGFGR
jgi:hypothetical protein